MKNLRDKSITYADWKRVAKRYGIDKEAIEMYMKVRLVNDSDEVDATEATFFNFWSDNIEKNNG